MNKLQFTQLVSWITLLRLDGGMMKTYELERLEELTTVAPDTVASKCDVIALDQLIALMAEGTRKIEAIRLHRQLTGFGLKESKDAVEKYWLLGRQQPITMDTF